SNAWRPRPAPSRRPTETSPVGVQHLCSSPAPVVVRAFGACYTFARPPCTTLSASSRHRSLRYFTPVVTETGSVSLLAVFWPSSSLVPRELPTAVAALKMVARPMASLVFSALLVVSQTLAGIGLAHILGLKTMPGSLFLAPGLAVAVLSIALGLTVHFR